MDLEPTPALLHGNPYSRAPHHPPPPGFLGERAGGPSTPGTVGEAGRGFQPPALGNLGRPSSYLQRPGGSPASSFAHPQRQGGGTSEPEPEPEPELGFPRLRPGAHPGPRPPERGRAPREAPGKPGLTHSPAHG